MHSLICLSFSCTYSLDGHKDETPKCEPSSRSFIIACHFESDAVWLSHCTNHFLTLYNKGDAKTLVNPWLFYMSDNVFIFYHCDKNVWNMKYWGIVMCIYVMLWFILSGKFRKRSFWFNNRRLSHPRNQSEMEVMCLRLAKLWPQKSKSTNKGTFIGANCMFDVLMRLLWGKIVYKTMNGFTRFISGIRDDFMCLRGISVSFC